MHDFLKTSKDLISSGQGGKLKNLMKSPEAQKVNELVDSKAVEEAAAKGDMDALKSVLSQVLSTDEGRKLAEQVSKAVEGK